MYFGFSFLFKSINLYRKNLTHGPRIKLTTWKLSNGWINMKFACATIQHVFICTIPVVPKTLEFGWSLNLISLTVEFKWNNMIVSAYQCLLQIFWFKYQNPFLEVHQHQNLLGIPSNVLSFVLWFSSSFLIKFVSDDYILWRLSPLFCYLNVSGVISVIGEKYSGPTR